jgi:hypothetical protein
MPAGTQQAYGKYPASTINYLVDSKLDKLAKVFRNLVPMKKDG